jgi:lysophospholipase
MGAFHFRFISARDGTRLRTGVFEPEKKSRRVCVLLSGHTEFIEKYLEVIGELNSRGFVVVGFDWRGQGGSQRPLANCLKSHIGDFAEFDNDLASVLEQVVRPISSAPPLVLAHSLGGHIALRSMHDRPGTFRAAVTTAPMLGVATGSYPAFFVRAMTALHARAGRARDFAWGMAKRDPLRVGFDAQLCTTDVRRYARTQDIIVANPAIRLAGPTWGWIEAAYRSMKVLSRPGYAEGIAAPVLIVAAGRDRIVDLEAERRFAARLENVKYVEIEDSQHEILMEQNSIREQFWQAFDAFVAGL